MNPKVKGILLIVLCTLFVSFGQFFWKKSYSHKPFYVFLIVGLFFYGVGSFLLLIALKHGKLVQIQPLVSLKYIWTTLLALFFLGETLTTFRLVGILVIFTGAILLSKGDAL